MPDWAEKAAQDFHNKWETGMSGAAFRDLQRALLAAEQRGRKAGLEAAANVAFDEMFEAVDAIRARKLQTAIRSLGEQE